MLLAKVALGLAGTVAVAGAYTFHEGVMSVQEERADGGHVHVWIPAAIVPLAMHAIPSKCLREHSRQAAEWFPLLRALTKELQHYPEAELVEVQDARQHVRLRTHNGKLLIDAVDDGETVHVVCPLVMMEEVAGVLEANLPPA